MSQLVQSNNVDKAADMAITILSVVDNNDQLKQDETVRLMMRIKKHYCFIINHAKQFKYNDNSEWSPIRYPIKRVIRGIISNYLDSQTV